METEIIQILLECGYVDVELLCQELENFEVDFSEVFEYVKENYGENHFSNFNCYMDALYETALRNVDFDYSKFGDSYSIFTNYIDSHLYINNEEVYNKKELEKAIAKLKGIGI